MIHPGLRPDYQKFTLNTDGNIGNVGERMQQKLRAIPLPDLQRKRVLDIGCDFGFWSFLSATRGASYVLGLDRGRDIGRGQGYEDLADMCQNAARGAVKFSVCDFQKVNIGKQWYEYPDLGRFDVIYLFSLYHHIFANCGDHSAIWFWLRRLIAEDGELLWENPVDDSDAVVRAHVPSELLKSYNIEEILKAAGRWFAAELIGPALHEPTRQVWRFRPYPSPEQEIAVTVVNGAGGATKAFEYADGRRRREIEEILGFEPYPGSLNLIADEPFEWNEGYYRAQVLDVVERGKGLDVEWQPRWARFYPVCFNGKNAHAFRFEGESYRKNFVELIASARLRDGLLDFQKSQLTRYKDLG
jgi:SAM-dependent methyltransferase